MHLKFLPAFIAVIFLLIAIFLFAVPKTGGHKFNDAKESVIIRKIGHEVLLLSGDSTSRVLPVKRLSENEYQIQFESNLTFIPDSLVNVIQQAVSANHLPPGLYCKCNWMCNQGGDIWLHDIRNGTEEHCAMYRESPTPKLLLHQPLIQAI